MKGVIFGAGVYGKKILRGLQEIYNVEVVAFCDNDKKKWGERIKSIPIISPQELSSISYDVIFISARRGYMFYDIKEQLVKAGVSDENIEIIELSKQYQDVYLDERRRWIRAFSNYINQMGVKGNVAECGVYRGETAMFINKYFPTRKLYLFDSFEGFREEDLVDEKRYQVFKEGEFADNPFRTEPAEDLIKIVKARMQYPENVIIKKGFFPDTASGVEDKFCFVNLDMDLYTPMLDGLRFFWNRMEESGCILLHDYFHQGLPGVKDAVKDFEKEIGKILAKMPIGDGCSLAVIKI